VAAIALVLLLLAAGCGGSDKKAAAVDTTASTSTSTTVAETTTTPTTAAANAACDLLSPMDIEAAVHVTVGEGEPSNEGDVTVCSFATADSSTTVKLSRHKPAGTLLEDTLASDSEAKELTGVGDGAVQQLHIGQVTTKWRDIGIVIQVTPAPTLAALTQLARVSAGKVG
jgi:hypothetical protein